MTFLWLISRFLVVHTIAYIVLPWYGASVASMVYIMIGDHLIMRRWRAYRRNVLLKRPTVVVSYGYPVLEFDNLSDFPRFSFTKNVREWAKRSLGPCGFVPVDHYAGFAVIWFSSEADKLAFILRYDIRVDHDQEKSRDAA